MRKHQDILRQSGQLAVAVALCIAAMLAVYALAGYYTTEVLVGALIGFVLPRVEHHGVQCAGSRC